MPFDEQPEKLSVIIPTYNRADLLRATLEHLARQRMPINEFEVIVADDGSSDDSAAVAESFSGRLRMKYTFQRDLGFRVAAARNAGARLATAPVLVFIDSGTVPGPNFLLSHVAEHARSTGHTAFCGYAYGYNPDSPVPGLAKALAELPPDAVVKRFRSNPDFRDIREKLLPGGFDLASLALPWLMFFGLNISISAADFRATGGFDEQFHGFGFEDLEFGFRLSRQGVRIQDSREAWLIEWPHERDMDRAAQEAINNLERFLRTHPEPAVEIGWPAALRGDYWSSEADYRALSVWSHQVHDLDVSGELAQSMSRVPAGDRVAVIGSGAVIPISMKGADLIDFDLQLLSLALSSGQYTGHHAVGVRTSVADQSLDTVIITSRLLGLWDRWGDDLLAEGHRIGRRVVTTFPR